MMRKTLEDYLKLPYKYVLHPAEEGGYVIEIPDLPGCISQGETITEAVNMIEDAKAAWIETALEDGTDIPDPARSVEEYSGKFNVRLPKSLHKALAETAGREGISLNQLILYELSKNQKFFKK